MTTNIHLGRVLANVTAGVAAAYEDAALSRQAGDVCNTLKSASRWLKTGRAMYRKAGEAFGAHRQCNEGFIAADLNLTCGKSKSMHAVHEDLDTHTRFVRFPSGYVRIL
jgi:hypothetical protein